MRNEMSEEAKLAGRLFGDHPIKAPLNSITQRAKKTVRKMPGAKTERSIEPPAYLQRWELLGDRCESGVLSTSLLSIRTYPEIGPSAVNYQRLFNC